MCPPVPEYTACQGMIFVYLFIALSFVGVIVVKNANFQTTENSICSLNNDSEPLEIGMLVMGFWLIPEKTLLRHVTL